ncbi:MAG: PHP domain-containing protein, partial [Yoonia sp.]
MAIDPRFIHLRVHTEYSLLQGAVHAKKLPDMATKMDMPAVAVTDVNNMFCALEFSETAAKAGIQPIIGCQVDLGYTTPEP